MSGKDETDGGVDSDIVFVRTTQVEIIDVDKEKEVKTVIQDAPTNNEIVGTEKNKKSIEVAENLNKLREIVEKGNAFVNQNNDTNTLNDGGNVAITGTNMISTTSCGKDTSEHKKYPNIESEVRNVNQKSNPATEALSINNAETGTEKSLPDVTVKVEPIREGYPEIDPSQYRVKIEPESEGEDDTSSDSSSSSSESEVEENPNVENSAKKLRSRQSSTSSQNDKLTKFSKDEIRTKGEVFPEELPALEDLTITVDDTVSLVHVGDVVSVVGVLAVVQSNQNMPPLNEETVIFLEGRVSCGKIFEVFGPVANPWYSLRFNSPEDVKEKGVAVGTKMYCAPKKEEYTNYVFVEHLKQIKGSDASWEDNNEPPDKFIDFSDDEEERRVKAKNRNKKQQENNDGEQLPGAKQRRKKPKQGSETNTEQQNNMTNQLHQRPNGPRKFSPFGGQLNRFQPRATYHQRFSRQPFSQGSGLTPSSFPPEHSSGQLSYQNTGQQNMNFVPSAGPTNNGQIPDFTRPPPNFSWNGGNRSQNCVSFQSYVPPQQSHMHGQTNSQTSYFPAPSNCSSFQNYNSCSSIGDNVRPNSNFVNSQDNDALNYDNTAYQSNNVNSYGNVSYNNNTIGPHSHGSTVPPSNNAPGDCNGFVTNNSIFQPPNQNGGPIVDNRFIQNTAFSQSTAHSQPPRFGGRSQFGRYNQPQ